MKDLTGYIVPSIFRNKLIVSAFDEKFFDLNNSTFGNYCAIYPNPVANYLSILSDTGEIYYLHVYNLSGRVRLQRLKVGSNKIDVSDFISGLYFVVLQSGFNELPKK